MNRYDRYAKSDKGRARVKRYKDKNKGKIQAQNKALYQHKDPKTCSVKGCDVIGERHHIDYDAAYLIIWLCRKHHKELHNPVATCQVWGCRKGHHAKGYCKMHYERRRKKADGWTEAEATRWALDHIG